ADCNFIKGFAWDKNYPEKALTVEVLEGSTILATVVADAYRSDLKAAGTGTGNYGFSIPAPAVLKDGATHSLSVRIKGPGTVLTGSPKSVNCALPASYGGGFDFLSCATIKGWAWDKNYPDKTLTVEIMEGSTIFGTVTASLYREDIKNKGYGTGNYGFNLSTPSVLKDGVTHSISLRVKGTNYIIPGSPRVITCASSARIATPEIAPFMPVEEPEDIEITVAPNPTSGKITAEYSLDKDVKANLSIVSSTGRVVWQKTEIGTGSKASESIDLSRYADGIYIFTLKTSAKTESKRIVLTK
ncbi:T9SS type A sorting domain-containing protein, partial [Dyadobacter crusticola]|uniref:T9SS type A sorting domain-containing protein n=1 Tax=Dyadobacter crusticola TaxID=292407 RepID=UPI0004E12BE9